MFTGETRQFQQTNTAGEQAVQPRCHSEHCHPVDMGFQQDTAGWGRGGWLLEDHFMFILQQIETLQ